MSNPVTFAQEVVIWWRVEVKVWRVEIEEWRSTLMAALHLARKSGNSGLSQSMWSSPLESSYKRKDVLTHKTHQEIYFASPQTEISK